jgi:hypothetical protein
VFNGQWTDLLEISMNRTLFLLTLLLVVAIAKGEDNSWLLTPGLVPKGSHICTLNTADLKTGRIVSSEPALLRGDLTTSRAENIVVAYSAQDGTSCRSAQIIVLQKSNKEWKSLAIFSYPDKYLWAEDGKTTGLQLIRLPGDDRDGLQVITAQGANLGAILQIFRWNPKLRVFENIVPPDAEGT